MHMILNSILNLDVGMYVKYVFRTLDTQGNGKITFTVRRNFWLWCFLFMLLSKVFIASVIYFSKFI